MSGSITPKMYRNKKNRDNVSEKIELNFSRHHILLIEDIVFGLLFFSLALLFSTNIQVHFTLPKLLALRIFALLLVFLWIVRFKNGLVPPLPKMLLYAVIGLFLWWVVTTFFAIHKPTALHGFYGRYNGFWNNAIFLLLFTITATSPVNEQRLKRILFFLICALIPVALYAIMQYYHIDPFSWPSERTASTIGHPVILAALLCLALPFVITFFFQEKEPIKKACWAGIAVLFIIAAISTLSRGPWIAIMVSSLLTGIMNAGKNRFRIILVMLVLFIVLVASFLFVKNPEIERIKVRLASITDFKKNTPDKMRMLYYKVSLQIIKEHPLNGIGFDNFGVIYPHYRRPEEPELIKDVLPSMVHNGYLQIAVQNGLPALMIYLFIISYIGYYLIKNYKISQNKNAGFFYAGFIASITGYLIQDLTGWPEIALTPFFWMLLGFSISFSTAAKTIKQDAMFQKKAFYLFASVCLVTLVFLIHKTINVIYADNLLWKSKFMDVRNDWDIMQSNIKAALNAVPGDFRFEHEAGILYTKRVNETGDRESYSEGAEILEKANAHNPFNPYVLIHRIDMDAIALKRGIISQKTDFTEAAIKQATIIDKNNPTVYLAIAQLRISEKKYADALEMARKIKSLREDGGDYLLEGGIYYAIGDMPNAIGSYRTALSLMREQIPLLKEWLDAKRGIPQPQFKGWLNAKHGISLSFMRKGEYRQALLEIEDAIRAFEEDCDSYVIRGDIYASMNNFGKARDSFAIAMSKCPGNDSAKRGLEQIEKILKK